MKKRQLLHYLLVQSLCNQVRLRHLKYGIINIATWLFLAMSKPVTQFLSMTIKSRRCWTGSKLANRPVHVLMQHSLAWVRFYGAETFALTQLYCSFLFVAGFQPSGALAGEGILNHTTTIFTSCKCCYIQKFGGWKWVSIAQCVSKDDLIFTFTTQISAASPSYI